MKRMTILMALLAGAACSKSSGGGAAPPAVSVFADFQERLYTGTVQDSDGSLYDATLQFFEPTASTINIEMRYVIGPDLFVRSGFVEFYGNALVCQIELTTGSAWTAWTYQPQTETLASRPPIDPPPYPVEEFFASSFGDPLGPLLLAAAESRDGAKLW